MTTKCRINLKDAVDDLAPPPPPCFFNRSGWMQYLQSAAATQNQRNEPVVILVAQDGAATFNFDFPLCADCSQVKSLEMTRQGRCNPEYLKQQGEKIGDA